MNRVLTDISLSCIIAGAILFGVAQCTKSRAEKPKAAAVLAIGCVDTGGTYTPTAISTFNSGVVTFNIAHFTRICNEVYVSGSLSATNAFDTVNSSLIQISLPIPSTAPFNEYGQALIGFNGTSQPTVGNIGFIHLVGATGAVVQWQSVKKNPYGLIYEFSYTIK